jgi:hypothetical protein
MTDEESPTESEPTQAAPVASEPTQSAPIVGQPAEVLTEVIPPARPWWRRPGVVGLLAGGVALITAIALVVVLVVLPDGSQEAEEQVFLTPLDDPGADPFTDASMATPLDQTMTSPGPDPAGAPPADPNATRTVYGDTDGLFGGTRNESTCDGQGLINYLQQQPAKAAAWASVHKISVDQIPGYIQQLTPVRLRADTRVLDHGYVNGQAYSRQAVLQALTAVMVDKFGMPRVRCMSGSPLLDIPEVQQIQTFLRCSRFSSSKRNPVSRRSRRGELSHADRCSSAPNGPDSTRGSSSSSFGRSGTGSSTSSFFSICAACRSSSCSGDGSEFFSVSLESTSASSTST